jgi:hypothetical protein
VLFGRQGNECAGLRSGTEHILDDVMKPADVRSNSCVYEIVPVGQAVMMSHVIDSLVGRILCHGMEVLSVCYKLKLALAYLICL